MALQQAEKKGSARSGTISPRALAWYHAADQAAGRPYIYLSAGVSNAEFRESLRLAAVRAAQSTRQTTRHTQYIARRMMLRLSIRRGLGIASRPDFFLLIRGAPLAEAGEYGNAAGALSVRAIGAVTGLLSGEEFERWKSRIPKRDTNN